MTEYRIADATPADVRPLARILGDWVRETGWMPVLHSREEDGAFVAGLIQGHVVRVASSGEATCGFLARRGGHVDALYLAPAGREVGIGRALLGEVKAAEPEVNLWTFAANDRAVAFYLRERFVIEERTDGSRNDERLPDLRLKWRRVP